MVNQIALVGKIVSYQKISTKHFFQLEVERPNKDEKGKITTLLVTCTLWKGAYDHMVQYYHIGDVIAIAGRLDSEEERLVVIVENIHVIFRGKSQAIATQQVEANE